MIGDVFVIAEAGVNHNGDLGLAFKLVDAAISAGADAVKFQTFKAENLATVDAGKAAYQQRSTGNSEPQIAMLKRLELGKEEHRKLLNYCEDKGIVFLSSAFDFESLDFLIDDLKLKTLKIGSGEITNGPLLLAHARSGCNIILSTGMSTLDEVQDALSVIAYGLLNNRDNEKGHGHEDFRAAFKSVPGQELLSNKVTLLHCTTEYPAPLDEINLNSMVTMRDVFGLGIGYSDHSEGFMVPVAAVALGAKVIEKHFTLDKGLPGPDHQASLNPGELSEMVKRIRQVETILGDGVKVPTSSELQNIGIARKSIVAAINIKRGDLFSEDNLSFKRPGTGRSPMEYWEMLGKESAKDYLKDEIIK